METTINTHSAAANPAEDNPFKLLIEGVFRQTGRRLKEDDLEVGILYLQHLALKNGFEQQAENLNQHIQNLQAADQIKKQAFEQWFDEKSELIIAAIEQLSQYRTDTLLELLSQNQKALDEAENKMYAGISAKIHSTVDKQLSAWWIEKQWWLIAVPAICVLLFVVLLAVILIK